MKRLVLLVGLAGLVGACDSGVSEPRGPLELTASVTGSAGVQLGAVLLSVSGIVEKVVVPGGQGRAAAEAERSVVVAAVASPRTTLTLDIDVPAGATPAIQILQVAGPDNEMYPDPTAFAVDIRERDGE